MQLHKRDVVAKAASILDSYGIADLTMRRLARELDVTPGALYWHFANKQELLGAVADQVLAPACANPAPAELARAHRGRLPCPARRTAVPHRRRRTGVGQLRRRAIARRRADPRRARRGGRRGRRRRPPTECRPPARCCTTCSVHRRRAVPAAVGRRRRELPEDQSVLTSDPSAGFAFGLRLLTDGLAAQRSEHRRPDLAADQHPLDALVAVPSAQADHAGTRCRPTARRTTASACATCSGVNRRPSVTCGVQCPGALCGEGLLRQMWQAPVDDRRDAGPAGRPTATISRASVNVPPPKISGAPTTTGSGKRGAQLHQLVVDVRVDPIGGQQRDVRAVGGGLDPQLAGQACVVESVPHRADRGVAAVVETAARSSAPSGL